jgi:hypothetical protein
MSYSACQIGPSVSYWFQHNTHRESWTSFSYASALKYLSISLARCRWYSIVTPLR